VIYLEDSALIKIISIVSLTGIAITALLHGIDSVLTGSISAIIGGIAGYEIGYNRGSKTQDQGGSSGS